MKARAKVAKEFTGNAEHLHYPLETDRQHLWLETEFWRWPEDQTNKARHTGFRRHISNLKCTK